MPLNLGLATLTTISSDAIAASGSLHLLRTEGGAASDQLVTISGGSEGRLLVVQPADLGHTIVVKDNTGNINLTGDFTMDSPEDSLTLYYSGSQWIEISRSDNDYIAIVAASAIKAPQGGDITSDAWVARGGSTNIDAWISHRFLSNSVIKATVSQSVNADAVLLNTIQASITIDSTLLANVLQSVTSNAAISGQVSQAITTDAFVNEKYPPWVLYYDIRIDAYINNPNYKDDSFVCDSVVSAMQSSSIASDCAIESTITGNSVTFDAKVGTVT